MSLRPEIAACSDSTCLVISQAFAVPAFKAKDTRPSWTKGSITAFNAAKESRLAIAVHHFHISVGGSFMMDVPLSPLSAPQAHG